MAERRHFGTYRAFFPYYVAMHAKPATRQVHFAGTTIGLALALFGLVTRRPRMMLALPGFGYGFAWPAHWFIEKNNPASFGHPLWSLRGDFEMIKYMLQGRDAELTEIAQNYLREYDPYGRRGDVRPERATTTTTATATTTTAVARPAGYPPADLVLTAAPDRADGHKICGSLLVDQA